MAKHIKGKAQYRIWKQKHNVPYPNWRPKGIWRGHCRNCNYYIQYWCWGAVSGALDHHDWQGCNVYKGPEPVFSVLYTLAEWEGRQRTSEEKVPDQAV